MPALSTMWGGIVSSWSRVYRCEPNCNCFRLFTHAMDCAFDLAFDSAGKSSPARMAMMAMTTRSSIKVKPWSNLLPVWGFAFISADWCFIYGSSSAQYGTVEVGSRVWRVRIRDQGCAVEISNRKRVERGPIREIG